LVLIFAGVAVHGWIRMSGLSKTSGVAVAAMSYLAERFGTGEVSAEEIALARRLTRPHVAKVMRQMVASGLVKGSRGPGGGYHLARAPEAIDLAQVVLPFEQSRQGLVCPFGPGWCGVEEPCPLHAAMVGLQDEIQRRLGAMTLEVFVK
jgi:Rrf2 family protein